MTASAYPDFRFSGQVSYIDPQVRSDTRTAKLRVEVPNPGARLRLGMFVDVSVGEGGGQASVVIPAAAVQALGDRYVVYMPGDEPGTFLEREVRVGRRAGELVQVESGLAPGDRIVSRGAFFLRAERERLSPGGGTP